MGKKRREPVPAEPLFPLIDGHTHLDSVSYTHLTLPTKA